MCTARQHFRHGSYRNGAIRVKKKKREKNVRTLLLIRVSSVKRVARGRKGGGRRVPVKRRNRGCSPRNFPPTRSTFLPFCESFQSTRVATSTNQRGWERQKRTRDARRCNMREYVHARISEHSCIRRFLAGNARRRKRNEFLSDSPPSAQHKSRRLSFTRTFPPCASMLKAKENRKAGWRQAEQRSHHCYPRNANCEM